MNLILSKMYRKIKKIPMPKDCYYDYYLPESIDCVCDCEVKCKFRPPSNMGMFKKVTYFTKYEETTFVFNKPVRLHEYNYNNYPC